MFGYLQRVSIYLHGKRRLNTCEWETEDPERFFQCKLCGASIRRDSIPVLPYRRVCKVQSPAGLGDLLFSFFYWLGVRPSRGCGCKQRQAALNRVLPFDWSIWRTRLRWLLWGFWR
jgi:hypothetical protein